MPDFVTVNGVKTLRQCEGCFYPLGQHIEAYENGAFQVEWYLCSVHDEVLYDYRADSKLYNDVYESEGGF